MSFSFQVKMHRPPQVKQFFLRLAQDGLKCLETLPPTGDWPKANLHFYLDGLSTRTTELSWQDGGMGIRIMAAATCEDHILAARIAKVLAELGGAPTITAEGQEPLSLDRFTREFDGTWARQSSSASTKGLIALCQQHGQTTFSIDGPNFSFCMGPQLMKELQAQQDGLELWERVQRRMLQVQGIDAHCASVIEAKNPGSNKITLAVWEPESAVLLPLVDYVVVQVRNHDDPIMVPYAKLAAVAGVHARLVDESQFLIAAFDEGLWPGLITRAKDVEEFPLGEPRQAEKEPDSGKKWWQFWKK